MSRRPTDHHVIIDESIALAARIGRAAPEATAIFYDGTAGDDRLLGSNFDDYFDMSQGGDDRVTARDGDDIIYFGAAFTDADRIDAGAGTDLAILDGDYSSGIDIGKSGLRNVELLGLVGGSYVITGFLAGEVDATSLTKHQTLDIAVAIRGRRALLIQGGDGDDVIHGALNGKVSGLAGGTGDDTLVGEGGPTTFSGGLGSDRIVFKGDNDQASFIKADSSPDAFDVIEGFRGSLDGATHRLLLYIDSDESKRGYQHNFHFGATPGRVGDIVIHYDAAIDHTIVDVFTNTDDTPDFTLHLTGNVPLVPADFAL